MNLKDICKAKGTNIKQLSEKINVPASTLYAISRGDTALENVGVSLFISLSQALDCTTDELYEQLSGNDMNANCGNLSTLEAELVDVMRSVTVEGQKQLMIYARGVKESYPKNHQLRETKTA